MWLSGGVRAVSRGAARLGGPSLPLLSPSASFPASAASSSSSGVAAAVRRAALATAAAGPKRRNELPSIDDAAAEVSYARGLFFGRVNAAQAFPYPDTLDEETRDTIRALVEPVDKFFREKVDSAKIDKESRIPPEVLDGLKSLGLFGLQIPVDLNGLGLSNTAYARVVERVCFDGSIAVTLLAHQSIGLKGILLNGNDAQKKKYLPRLATGEHIAAFALTEPTSGSDAQSIRTRAKLSADGKHFILNGSKIWISNGGWAEIFTVFAQTEVDGRDKVTAFIVERSFGGLTSGKPESKLGIKGSNTCQIFFDNVKIPIENVLGEVGGGFKVAMNILNNGRFGLGAGSGAMIKLLIGMFGRTLNNFGLIKEKFGNMALDGYAIESMAYMTTGMIDRKDPDCYVEAAMCKVYGSEASWRSVNECIQIMGGLGFMTDWPYERAMRDSRILSIFEGTNEILRMLIALQGVRAVGDRLNGLGKIANKPALLWEETSQRLARRFNVLKIDGVPDELDPVVQQLGWHTSAFGRAVERMLLSHGKGIIEQQTLLKRVADIAIELYALTAVLSRATRSLQQGLPTADHEKRLCLAFAHRVNNSIDANLLALRQGADANGDTLVASIADDVFAHKKYLPPHPTGV